MGEAATLIVVVIALLGAIHQLRQNRRRGIRIVWSKTLVTGAGVVLITGLAMAALFACLRLGREGLAVAAFLGIYGIGFTALIVCVNRRWPRRGA